MAYFLYYKLSISLCSHVHIVLITVHALITFIKTVYSNLLNDTSILLYGKNKHRLLIFTYK
jgi:hypothetical protein